MAGGTGRSWALPSLLVEARGGHAPSQEAPNSWAQSFQGL